MKLRRLSTRQSGFDAKLAALTRYEAAQGAKVERTVRAIIADVRARGDAAVLEYTRKFDGVKARSIAELEIPRRELQFALKSISIKELDALRVAARRIRRFHER